MGFKVVFTTDAEYEFLDAVAWYELQRSGLGSDLILCVEEAFEVLSRNPYFEIRYNESRVYNIRRFPYQLIFFTEGDNVFVTSFFHAHKDPDKWREKP